MNATNDMPAFFSGFRRILETVNGVTINGVIGGSGPPVLLLHGYPQTHVIWRHVAADLARDFTVVATDLRGYGDSSKPETDEQHMPYSKREMATDQVELMQRLGFERFAVVGHDRGGRVGHRLARDHPKQVSHLAVLDIAPTESMYGQTNFDFAKGYYHWFFLIQPRGLPETLIGNNVEFYMRHKVKSWGDVSAAIPEDVFAEYLRCYSDPACIHATCEDYRASAGIDLEHDRQDQEPLDCPVLALWGAEGFVARTYDVLAEWRAVAKTVSGCAVPGGHYVPEEAPSETIKELRSFLA